MDNDSDDPRASSTAIMLLGLVVAVLSLPVSAFLLWDDHRGLAWIAIAGVVLGFTPLLALPVGVGFFVFALTESPILSISASVVSLLIMFGLPLLLETSAERSKAGGASPRKTWGGVPTLRSLALLLVVLLAGYGAYNLYQKWDDEGLQSATQAAPPATVVAGGATVPARRESTAATNSTAVGCDGVLEWGAANHKRQEEAGLLLEKFDDSSRVEQIKLSDLIRARNALQDLVVEQRESDPPPAAIRLNDTFVAAFTAAAEILDGMINGDRSTTAGATTELQRLDAQMQSQTEDLALLCDI